jgi:hypothetical protein
VAVPAPSADQNTTDAEPIGRNPLPSLALVSNEVTPQ